MTRLKDVAADHVGAERMGQAGRQQGAGEVLLIRVVGCDDRRKDSRQHDRPHDRHADLEREGPVGDLAAKAARQIEAQGGARHGVTSAAPVYQWRCTPGPPEG